MNPSSQQPFKLRPALTSDAPAIAELGARVFTASVTHAVDSHELALYLEKSYSRESILKDLTDNLKTILVATDETNRVVGFTYLTRGNDEPCLTKVNRKIELQRIYIDPAAQGMGLGRLLAGKIESLAREQGFQNIWLGVWEGNKKARVAYERWGYEVVGDHDFKIGSLAQRDLIMLKRL